MSTLALFDLADFAETRSEWVPLVEPTVEDFGWTFDMGDAVPRRADGQRVTKADWKEFLAVKRCRDCGTTHALNQGGSDAGLDDVGRGYSVCDDCANIDDCLPTASARNTSWHVSRWGDRHAATDHDGLVVAREKRRAAYLRKASS